jgi:hypothetical protein
MSSGNVIHLENDDFNVNFREDGSFTVKIPVVNEDDITDYAIKVPWSISQGTSTLGSGTINSRVGPGSTRVLEVMVDTQLDPGTELFICASAEIDPDNIGGL